MDTGKYSFDWLTHYLAKSSSYTTRAALTLVRARVLCQMRAPYRPITS